MADQATKCPPTHRPTPIPAAVLTERDLEDIQAGLHLLIERYREHSAALDRDGLFGIAIEIRARHAGAIKLAEAIGSSSQVFLVNGSTEGGSR